MQNVYEQKSRYLQARDIPIQNSLRQHCPPVNKQLFKQLYSEILFTIKPITVKKLLSKGCLKETAVVIWTISH